MSTTPLTPESIEEYTARWMAEIPPALAISALPQRDQARAAQLIHSFRLLTSFIDQFAADVTLFDYANSNQQTAFTWAAIACRDASLNLWDFSDALDLIRKIYHRCKSVHNDRRSTALTTARKFFDDCFPHAKAMRDTAAHPVGHLGSRGRENSSSQSQIIVHNSWAGRAVINTYQGREISFEISTATVESLRVIRKVVFDSFK